jgi:hypothetical protein
VTTVDDYCGPCDRDCWAFSAGFSGTEYRREHVQNGCRGYWITVGYVYQGGCLVDAFVVRETAGSCCE